MKQKLRESDQTSAWRVLRVCARVCMRVHVCTCAHVCRVCVRVRTRAYVCVRVCPCAYVRVRACVRVYTCYVK